MLSISIMSLNIVCATNVDSLNIEFNKAHSNQHKIDISLGLVKYYLYKNPDSSDYYLHQLENEGRRVKSDSILCMSALYFGYSNSQKGNTLIATTFLLKSLSIAKSIKHVGCQDNALNILMNVYVFRVMMDSAEYYMNERYKLIQAIDDPIIHADFYFSKGLFYGQNDEHDKSLKSYLISDSIFMTLGTNDINHGNVLSNIGVIFLRQKNLNKSIEYFTKAENVYQLSNNIYGQNLIRFRFAEVYFQKHDYKKAKKYANEALPFFEENSIYPVLIDLKTILSNIYYKEGNKEESITYSKEALSHSKTIGDTSKMASSANSLGRSYLLNKDFNKAVSVFMEALEYANATNKLGEKVEIVLAIAEAYENLGDYKNATNYLKRYKNLHDSLQEKRAVSEVNELEAKYETKLKDSEIERLRLANNIQIQKKRNQLILFFTIFLVFALLAFILFYTNRKKIVTAQKIKELDNFKTAFFNNISHEFRTPLTLIKSPLQQLISNETDIQKLDKYRLIDKSTNRMIQLVDQILTLSKIQNNEIHFLFKKISLKPYFSYFIEPYQYHAEQKDISLHLTNTVELNAWVDMDILDKILSNLLGNALKFTPKKGEIELHIEYVPNENLRIIVTNKPVEITEPDKIFERHYQGSKTEGGAGIGLSLVKELVKAYKGNVNYTYQNNTLCMEVVIPTSKTDLALLGGVFIESQVQLESSSNPQNMSKELPSILIADDNPSIIQVLSDFLNRDFLIFSASNGVDAFKKAKEIMPDLVITDIMMPGSDGFSLIKKLKNNPLTSFVPIMVLTANENSENELTATNLKVDAYFLKPFNNEIIKSKVHAILESRKQLQEKYSQELILNPITIDVPDLDKEFIDRAQNSIESNLSNSEFSVEDFASNMAMSRMQLHRKLKLLLGISATEYIKQYRLQTAKILLENSKLNVSEVAYNTGFNDPNYFSKCYKDIFGESPNTNRIK